MARRARTVPHRSARRRWLAGVCAPIAAAAVVVAAAQPATARPAAAPATAHRHTVSYDHWSLLVDGRRVMLLAGEFHYWRLPSPDLWRDVLEKYRAAGMNAVSVYFDWAYHSPAPGVYDFTGVRDVDRFLRTAEDLGLYVIARPGPYINAETTGGGFPAWLTQVPGRARSSAPGYQAAYRDWLAHIDAVLAPHQVTRGGSVILYNAENEYAVNTDAAYMADIQRQARADGIDVPITANDCCDAASWSSTWATGAGSVQIPGVDDYPQSFECQAAGSTWGPWGEGVTERLREDAPVFAAEYQAGAIDVNGAGYAGCRDLTGVEYTRFFDKQNVVASGATAFSYYMFFGGTSWGWLPQPDAVYSSYDYGAAIDENRQLTAKYDEFKRQGYLLTTVAPLTKTDPTTGPVPDNPAVQATARRNPDTGTQLVLVRHTDRAATTTDTATLDWATADGRYRLPVTLDGRDARLLLAGYDLGGQRLVVSSSELMTHADLGGRDVALLYGRAGEPGETVLRYASAPTVRVLAGSAGSVASAFDPATGDLRLDYTHTGLARVLISGGGRRPLLLLLATDQVAATFWRLATPDGTVLVRGTALARSAALDGGAVRLRADTTQAGEVEVFAPAAATRLWVNDRPVIVRRTAAGSLLGWLPGPAPVTLPALSWRSRPEAPEAAPGFDDSAWTVADHTTTPNPYAPQTLPVLYADDYGFHYGNVWYRGHFTATGTEAAVSLNADTGKNGIYLAWLNGHYLGWAAGGTQADDAADGNHPDAGKAQFAVPPGVLAPGRPATLSVLVENMGHNDDWIADDLRFKQPRGLVGAALVGSSAPIGWRIQGSRGGEQLADPTRGPLNTGGLFGERAGWHLPGAPDRGWQAGPLGAVPAGVTWYRSEFGLRLPRGQDTAVDLRFAGAPGRYRVLVFLNGWNVGQYLSGGAQRDFALPAGLLRGAGRNTLALAVIAPEPATAGIGPVSLVSAGTARGGVPVGDVP